MAPAFLLVAPISHCVRAFAFGWAVTDVAVNVLAERRKPPGSATKACDSGDRFSNAVPADRRFGIPCRHDGARAVILPACLAVPVLEVFLKSCQQFGLLRRRWPDSAGEQVLGSFENAVLGDPPQFFSWGLVIARNTTNWHEIPVTVMGKAWGDSRGMLEFS